MGDWIGLAPGDLPAVKRLLARPNGILLVTGPTGSGKSTTLAAICDEINHSRPVHIVTLEDPVEFVHVHERQGELPLVARSALEFPAQQVLEGPPVEQPGQASLPVHSIQAMKAAMARR